MAIAFCHQRAILILSVLFSIMLGACCKKTDEVFYYHFKNSCPGCQRHEKNHIYTMVEKYPREAAPREGLITKGIKGTGRLVRLTDLQEEETHTYSVYPARTITVIEEQT